MPVIGNIVPRVISTQVIDNTQSASIVKNLLRGWTHTVATGDISSTAIGTDVIGVPPNGNTYYYNDVLDLNGSSLGAKYGFDTGLVDLIVAPAGGKVEIAPMDGVSPAVLTWTLAGNHGGGTTNRGIYVELNGIVIVSVLNATGTWTLTLDTAQASALIANNLKLRYRMYHVGNGNPVNASGSFSLSNGGILVTKVV